MKLQFSYFVNQKLLLQTYHTRTDLSTFEKSCITLISLHSYKRLIKTQMFALKCSLETSDVIVSCFSKLNFNSSLVNCKFHRTAEKYYQFIIIALITEASCALLPILSLTKYGYITKYLIVKNPVFFYSKLFTEFY